MTLRWRTETRPGSGIYRPRWREETWSPEETAVIVCDMWDSHHCYNAVQRVKDMAVRMNAFLHQARDAGALIIHAPSSCTAPYADHPARQRAINAPQADNVPEGISEWCHQIDAEHVDAYPIDQSDGGEDDDPEVHRRWHEQLTALGRNPRAPWVRQIDVLEIDDEDAITDDGVETWNLLEQYGIKNVILVGVHTNMCVLGRPFGLRQMAQNGKHVVLVRDLTDTMYNPASWPQVAHHTGTDYIIEYIEKFVCPTIESTDLLGGKPFRFYDDRRPTVAIIVSEFEYQTYRTLPEFARRYLGKDFHVEIAINDDQDDHALPGTAILENADVAVLSMWRRTLPEEQLAPIRAFLDRGGSLVAIRTSSHAFVSRDGTAPEGHTSWPDFDRVILGGHYRGHHGNHADRDDPPTTVWLDARAIDHPSRPGDRSGAVRGCLLAVQDAAPGKRRDAADVGPRWRPRTDRADRLDATTGVRRGSSTRPSAIQKTSNCLSFNACSATPSTGPQA